MHPQGTRQTVSIILYIFCQDSILFSRQRCTKEAKRRCAKFNSDRIPINFTLIYPNSTSWSIDSPWEAYSIKRVLQAQQWWSDIPFLSVYKPRVYDSNTWIELQAGGLVHCMEKIVRARIRWRSVSYCSIGIYVLDVRFSHPRADNFPVRSAMSTAPFPARLSKGSR